MLSFGSQKALKKEREQVSGDDCGRRQKEKTPESRLDSSPQQVFHRRNRSTASFTSETRKYFASEGCFRATSSYMA